MTAEIALLNKSAVALAADSAMTVQGTGKIYPSNKLFALTKWHPIGIMIYANAEFMGVPWETIIKMYRQSIGRTAKTTVQEYLIDFLTYISTSPFCTEEQQSVNFLRIASITYANVLETVNNDLRTVFNEKKGYSSRDASRAIRKAIDERLAELEEIPESKSMENINVSHIVSTNKNEVNKRINFVFREFRLSQSAQKSLHRILQLTIKSAELSRGCSGIVMAGFGESEMFPTLYQVTTDGMLAGNLKYELHNHTDIERKGIYTSIVPFAQTDMVNRFMEGVDPEFLNYLRHYTRELLLQFVNEILDAHGVEPSQHVLDIGNAANGVVSEYFSAIKNFQKNYFIDPIIEVVGQLPKEELGGMAEALVNLTSLKHRVSLDQETVGGPVDIAIISKGDGFVWTKRKHYFDTALNPSYFNRQSYQTKQEKRDDQCTERDGIQ